jgi:hypothetical protein
MCLSKKYSVLEYKLSVSCLKYSITVVTLFSVLDLASGDVESEQSTRLMDSGNVILLW